MPLEKNIRNNIKYKKEKISKNKIFIILVVSGCMMGSFSHTAFSSIFELIMKQFSLSADEAQLMTSIYSMTIGITTILSVFLTKNINRKVLFLGAMFVFGSGVLFTAISFNYVLILTGRVFQAIGSGIILTLSQVVLLSSFSKQKTGLIMGIYGFMLNLSSALAPVITIMLVKKISWQTIMWWILIMSVFVIFLTWFKCHRRKKTHYENYDEKENINLYSCEKSKMSANCTLENCSGKQDLKENKFFKQTNLTGNFCRYFNSLRLFLYQKIIGLFKNFDIISFLFSSISVIFLMLACMSIRDISVKDINYWQKNLTADEFVKISEYAILKVVLYSCISIVFILIFISRQKKMKNPYIRLELFKNKRFMAVVVTSIFIYGIMMGTALWFPVYINRMTGAGMERAGYIMLPGAVIMAVSSVLGGWLYQKYGIRLLYAISICSFILAFITRNVVPIWVMYSFRSIGIGAIMMPMTAWGMKEIKKEYYSDGTAIICSLRTIAGALGTAIASILV